MQALTLRVLAGTLVIALAVGIGQVAYAAARRAGEAELMPVGLTEQTLPAESMPTASATAAPTPGAASASTPGAAQTQSVAPPSGPAIAATPDVGLIAPSPIPTPQPYELGSVEPAQPVSDNSLKPLIEQAALTMPARAASMRLADRARAALLKRRPGKALRLLARAVSIDPSDPYAYFYLGRAYMERKNYAQAVIFLKRAEVYFAANPVWLSETLSFEGVAYEQSAQPAAAQSAYQRALAAEPNSLMAMVGYARVSQALTPVAAGPAPAPPSAINLHAPAQPPIPAAPAEPTPGPPPGE